MFDLPVETANQRRAYRQFVKALKKNGFIMFQESIYIKLSINQANVNSTLENVKKYLPKDGLVSMLTITEKQFNDMELLLGDFVTETINSDERVIEL